MNALWIFLGGGLGSLARWGLSGLVARQFGESFPWGTLVVNVTGSFAIGFIFTITGTEARHWLSPAARNFLMVGICGGYTTFSSFSLQTLNLARDGQWLYAGFNILGSVALCLVATWLGYLMAQTLNR